VSGHTPLPWKERFCDICGPDCDDGDDLVLGCVGRSYGLRSAEYGIVKNHTPEGKANAAFIVRACNSHYELLEALEDAVQCIEPDVYPSAYSAARAAISKAKGGAA